MILKKKHYVNEIYIYNTSYPYLEIPNDKWSGQPYILFDFQFVKYLQGFGSCESISFVYGSTKRCNKNVKVLNLSKTLVIIGKQNQRDILQKLGNRTEFLFVNKIIKIFFQVRKFVYNFFNLICQVRISGLLCPLNLNP